MRRPKVLPSTGVLRVEPLFKRSESLPSPGSDGGSGSPDPALVSACSVTDLPNRPLCGTHRSRDPRNRAVLKFFHDCLRVI